MSDSSSKSASRKPSPAKPHKDFPLTPRGDGRWCKKVRGKLHYFVGTADEALAEWLRVRDDLLAGRKPRAATDGVTVADLVNAFLNSKRQLVETGEITQRSLNDYVATCLRVSESLGKSRAVADLAADDFEKLRAGFAEGRNATTIGNEIQRTRTLFKYGYDSGLLDVPMRFGPSFKRPSKKVRRKLRNETGEKLFAAHEIAAMLSEATPQHKAMILLGINAGFGNHDCACLPTDRVDLGRGWHNFGRPKTGVERRCPLWPETVAALKTVLAKRPEPRNESDSELLFLTRHRERYVRLNANGTWNDAISRETDKLLRKLGIKRPGISFYTLRRTFRTVADEAGDQPAAIFIMGHAASDSDMSDIYRQRIADERLERVTSYVRRWLLSAMPAES